MFKCIRQSVHFRELVMKNFLALEFKGGKFIHSINAQSSFLNLRLECLYFHYRHRELAS